MFSKFKDENLDGDAPMDLPPHFLHYQGMVHPKYQVSATIGKHR